MKNLVIAPKVESLANNQFLVKTSEGVFFQSYTTVIAAILYSGQILLDAKRWNYSVTTAKYRNRFLDLTTKETEKLIASGKIVLTDLN